MFRRTLASAIAAVSIASAGGLIRLNEKEYFEGPGFSFLVFHNNYQVGYQGGLQMIQHEERLLDSGDFYLISKMGASLERRPLERTVDAAAGAATVTAEAPAWKLGYRLVTRTDGARILITLELDRPIDWARAWRAGFRICVYPGAYYGKSFQSENVRGVFPREALGAALVSSAHVLRIAQEDRLRSFTIRREDGGELSLIDPRGGGSATPGASEEHAWFLIEAPIPSGSAARQVSLAIEPAIDAAWRRPPVIAVSQAGYHPNQPKQAVLELDPRDTAAEPVTLARLDLAGGVKPVKSAVPKRWGKFLRYNYAILDFSEVREPGLYVLDFRGVKAGPFLIDAAVYNDLWKPTLEYFLPVQMCHVAVKDHNRTWHGACHLDDALQAPAHTTYVDDYQQGERETRFGDNEHVPGLDWGGWHDAGDSDLPAGSIALTTVALALAEEEFHPTLDQTTIRRGTREVLLHRPDGVSDLAQQIEFGIEGLLASFRVAGYIFPGIIESTTSQYNHIGDPVNITDNRVFDKNTNPHRDDRWVFTNRNTGLEYQAVQALAAASRVLPRSSPAGVEALAAARKIYDDEQQRPPVYAPSSYCPSDSGFRAEEIAAAAELFFTTGEGRYRDRLVALVTRLENAEHFGRVAASLARALPAVNDPGFTAKVTGLAEKWREVAARRAAANPFGVPYPPEVLSPSFKLERRSGVNLDFIWGHGWMLQEQALNAYYLQKHLPGLFGKEAVFNVVSFVLGAHPASNESFVSGVGGSSALAAYEFDVAAWTHIPGGVISGASLVQPDFLERKEFPFLWYQNEYVIGGAATYIFDVLAAEKLAARR